MGKRVLRDQGKGEEREGKSGRASGMCVCVCLYESREKEQSKERINQKEMEDILSV